jgi:hypothetical protein
MRYQDLKIKENVTKDIVGLLTRPIIKYFTRNCNDEKRINQQLTNLRKNLAKYPEKRNPVIQGLSAYPVLAKLVKGTVYPIQIAGSGFSTPEYKKEMCIKGKSQGGIGLDAFGGPGGKVDGTTTNGTKDGTTTNGTKDGTTTNGTKDGTTTNGTKDGGGEKTTGDKFGTEKTTFGNFLDNNDLAGALKFLDGNPAFEKAIGSKFRTDIQSALDAQEAKERNRLAQEKADKEAEEAQRIADEKAAKEAKEKADAAAEAKRIADAEEQKRLDAIEAERKAAEAKKAKDEADAKAERERQQAELDRLEKEAEQARIAAEKLEKERIEAEAEAQRIADEEEAKKAEKENDRIVIPFEEL